MSTLWTPGGERPMPQRSPTAPGDAADRSDRAASGGGPGRATRPRRRPRSSCASSGRARERDWLPTPARWWSPITPSACSSWPHCTCRWRTPSSTRPAWPSTLSALPGRRPGRPPRREPSSNSGGPRAATPRLRPDHTTPTPGIHGRAAPMPGPPPERDAPRPRPSIRAPRCHAGHDAASHLPSSRGHRETDPGCRPGCGVSRL